MQSTLTAIGTLSRHDLDELLPAIAVMNRCELIEQFRSYPAPFPVDFSDDFLNAQSLDKLRHVFAGLVMHCRVMPSLHAAA